jgi:hypothetical protein
MSAETEVSPEPLPLPAEPEDPEDPDEPDPDEPEPDEPEPDEPDDTSTLADPLDVSSLTEISASDDGALPDVEEPLPAEGLSADPLPEEPPPAEPSRVESLPADPAPAEPLPDPTAGESGWAPSLVPAPPPGSPVAEATPLSRLVPPTNRRGAVGEVASDAARPPGRTDEAEPGRRKMPAPLRAPELASSGARRMRARDSGSSGPSSLPKIKEPATRCTIAGSGTLRPLAANRGIGTTSTKATKASSRAETVNAVPEPAVCSEECRMSPTSSDG